MLLVSIHDVSPAQELQVSRLWDLCVGRGVKPALLVVPNWHGEWPLEDYPGFVDWLRARADEGAEIVLHGERHDEVGSNRRLRDQWRAWGKTSDEGEFLTLDMLAAGARIAGGLARLRQLGLEPIGFVAPAWLARKATYQAAAEAGLAFSEDNRCIRLLRTGRKVRSPVVRWSARTPTRAWASVAVAGGRWMLQRGSNWPRMAFHPRDLEHPATAASIRRALDRWLGRHHPGRYADLSSLLPSA